MSTVLPPLPVSPVKAGISLDDDSVSTMLSSSTITCASSDFDAHAGVSSLSAESELNSPSRVVERGDSITWGLFRTSDVSWVPTSLPQLGDGVADLAEGGVESFKKPSNSISVDRLHKQHVLHVLHLVKRESEAEVCRLQAYASAPPKQRAEMGKVFERERRQAAHKINCVAADGAALLAARELEIAHAHALDKKRRKKKQRKKMKAARLFLRSAAHAARRSEKAAARHILDWAKYYCQRIQFQNFREGIMTRKRFDERVKWLIEKGVSCKRELDDFDASLKVRLAPSRDRLLCSCLDEDLDRPYSLTLRPLPQDVTAFLSCGLAENADELYAKTELCMHAILKKLDFGMPTANAGGGGRSRRSDRRIPTLILRPGGRQREIASGGTVVISPIKKVSGYVARNGRRRKMRGQRKIR